jgi:hypothetical protein
MFFQTPPPPKAKPPWPPPPPPLSQPPPPAPPQPSDASIALAVHAADLARAEEDHRFTNAYRVYHAWATASACVTAHDALFARQLAQVPEDRWAHDGDNIERPLDLDATKPLFHGRSLDNPPMFHGWDV